MLSNTTKFVKYLEVLSNITVFDRNSLKFIFFIDIFWWQLWDNQLGTIYGQYMALKFHSTYFQICIAKHWRNINSTYLFFDSSRRSSSLLSWGNTSLPQPTLQVTCVCESTDCLGAEISFWRRRIPWKQHIMRGLQIIVAFSALVAVGKEQTSFL